MHTRHKNRNPSRIHSRRKSNLASIRREVQASPLDQTPAPLPHPIQTPQIDRLPSRADSSRLHTACNFPQLAHTVLSGFDANTSTPCRLPVAAVSLSDSQGKRALQWPTGLPGLLFLPLAASGQSAPHPNKFSNSIRFECAVSPLEFSP